MTSQLRSRIEYSISTDNIPISDASFTLKFDIKI